MRKLNNKATPPPPTTGSKAGDAIGNWFMRIMGLDALRNPGAKPTPTPTELISQGVRKPTPTNDYSLYSALNPEMANKVKPRPKPSKKALLKRWG